jgi:hypothetical protein
VRKTEARDPRGGAAKPTKKRKKKFQKPCRGYAYSRERLVKSNPLKEISMSQPCLRPKRASASVLAFSQHSLGRRPRRPSECLPPSFLRAVRSVQPVPRAGTRSVCPPAVRHEAGVQAGLTPAKTTEKADEP